MGSPVWVGRKYVPGTRVQYRTGYIYVKTGDGMKPEARQIWERHHGELTPGDRVFHLDGNRENNQIGNLAKVHFNDTKFTLLKASRVLWVPTQPRIKVIDTKTKKWLVNS